MTRSRSWREGRGLPSPTWRRRCRTRQRPARSSRPPTVRAGGRRCRASRPQSEPPSPLCSGTSSPPRGGAAFAGDPGRGRTRNFDAGCLAHCAGRDGAPHDLGCRTLFSTHSHELADAAEAVPHAVCMAMDASAGRHGAVFSYRVMPGRAGRSYGLQVAALAVLPRSVLRRAEQLLAEQAGEVAASPVEASETPHGQA
ncbi:hypothetical protein E2C05_25520 [Paracraurococcus ruber]|nr:hypothetical protein E2C05_25520 [Paracraurococcus ruber]